MAAAHPPPKPCLVCGRPITWRKKWERDWDQVKYCGDACRRRKSSDVDATLEATILALLKGRKGGATICPSEAARAVAADGDWRPLMEPARGAARRLAGRGLVQVTQGGRVVDPGNFRGPIRLRLTK